VGYGSGSAAFFSVIFQASPTVNAGEFGLPNISCIVCWTCFSEGAL
jgi:hypothetical protein